MLLLNLPELNNLLSFKKYIIRIANLYSYIVIVNIKKYVKYSHCGPTHFSTCNSCYFKYTNNKIKKNVYNYNINLRRQYPNVIFTDSWEWFLI